MSLNAANIIDVRTGGIDTNGGFFNPTNANMQTDLTCTVGDTASPVVSSAGYGFFTADVGSWLFIKSGTSWTPGWYQIASIAGGSGVLGNTATLTAGIGSAFLYLNQVPMSPTTVAGCSTVATQSANKATWTIDYSQQNTAAVTGTVSTHATTTIDTFSGTFTKAMVGNGVYLQGGSGPLAATWVEFSAYVSTTSFTCAGSSPAAGTGVTCTVGGGLLSPGQAGGIKVGSNTVFLAAGTYALNNATANTSGGPVTDSTGGTNASGTYWSGWNTNRCVLNTDSTHAVVSVPNSATYNSVKVFNNTSSIGTMQNIDISFAGATPTNTVGIYSVGGSRKTIKNCKVTGSTLYGFQTDLAVLLFCQATGCAGTAGIEIGDAGISNTGTAIGCESYANTCTGFNINASATAIECFSYGNTGVSSNGFAIAGSGNQVLYGCIAYGNGQYGIATSTIGLVLINCIVEGNTSDGINSAGSVNDVVSIINCAGYNNGGAGNYSTTKLFRVFNFVAQSAGTFFAGTPATDHNFAPNTIAGQGALLKAAGFPGLMPRGLTTGYQDIGVQHQDAGGGTVTNISVRRFNRVHTPPSTRHPRRHPVIIPAAAVTVPIIIPPHRRQYPVYIPRRRTTPAAFLVAPQVVTILRTPPRTFTRQQFVRRNAGNALFSSVTNNVNQTVLVMSPRKVR